MVYVESYIKNRKNIIDSIYIIIDEIVIVTNKIKMCIYLKLYTSILIVKEG